MKKSLGKGLSALLAEANASFEGDATSNGSIAMMPLSDIVLNPNQPRKIINEAEIAALSESIREHGVIQPIVLRKIEHGKYRIIAGERRYRAASAVGLSQIPSIVLDINEIEAFEIAVIENIQRENLTILEEAEAYRKLIDEYGHTQESLAQSMGKSRSHISNTMRLLKLPVDVLEMLRDGDISAAHARAIINAPNPSVLAKNIVTKRLNVRETEKMVQNLLDGSGVISNAKDSGLRNEYANDILQTERMLSRALGADVRIKYGKNDCCNITIKCRGMESLDEIISRLEGGQFDL